MDTEKVAGKKCRGRPASFDRDQLITQVMELFWERGYANLSLNEVARATGLTRASLYNAFATKEALFLEAIEQYQAHSPERLLEDLGDDDPVGPALYRMFDAISQHLAADSKHRGCLAVNCMTEQLPDTTELGAALAAMHKRKRRLFQKVIQKAIVRQELPESTGVEVCANILQAFLNGLSVYSKNGAAEQELLAMSRTFLKNMGFVEPSASK
jgi:TetR/AcrR family transcriptional repressor of nem operon